MEVILFISRTSLYRIVRTLHLYFKNQSINILYDSIRYLFCDSCKTQKIVLCLLKVKFLNVKTWW